MVSPDKKKSVLDEAKARFKRTEEWEQNFWRNFDADIQFEAADSRNGYQWDVNTRKDRAIKRQPSLTVNWVRQACLHVINDARQNKAQIRVVPVSDDASYEAAEVFEGVVRHIEYISNAETVYTSAIQTQVKGGIGYWRVNTGYKNNRSNDQEIFIRRIKDPKSVRLDPDITEFDGSDARFGFIFVDMPRDLFKKKYPKYAEDISEPALGNTDDWNQQDTVRIAEYYCKSEKRDELIIDKYGKPFVRSKLGAEMAKLLKEDPDTTSREILEDVIDWYLIIGDEVVEHTVWPGKYIPIVRVVGEETVIDGEMDRKGHVRAMIDAQRMFNYWASAATEQIALQTKTPWIAPLRAVEGLEEKWSRSAIEQYGVIPWRDIDDQGNPVAPPQRVEPPTLAQAYMAGLEMSKEQMMMVSGQHEATMGEPGDEKSGKAINARQRQGENATYHFIDNFATALRFTGKILIDLIPKIYDTKRVVQILAENGDRSAVTIDPNAPQPHMTTQSEQSDPEAEAQVIFNPAIGEYSVEADVGPAYQTRRQEAFQAFIDIATTSPEIMAKAGDIMFRAADFPMAEDIAERLKPGPPPEVQQLIGEMQKKDQTIAKLMDELMQQKAEAYDRSGKLHLEGVQKQIDIYKAETDRIAHLKDLDPEMLRPLVMQLVAEALGLPMRVQGGMDVRQE